MKVGIAKKFFHEIFASEKVALEIIYMLYDVGVMIIKPENLKEKNTELIHTIEREKHEPFYSFYLKYSPEWLLAAFKNRSAGETVKRWDVIPSEQYEGALRRFMEEPVSFRIPERVINGWVDIVMKNTCQLISFNKLYGRTNCYKADIPRLRSMGFWKWASGVWSDVGVLKLYDIIREYREDMSAGEKLVLVNRCINVVHIRGSLARFFIEGGKDTCDRISSGG